MISAALAGHKEATVSKITAMIHNAPVLLVAAILGITAGLAIILKHSVWSGGATPVIVSLTGWIALTKGSLLLFLTPEAEVSVFIDGMHFEQLFYVYFGMTFALGAYLTYRGFTTPPTP